MMSDSKNIYFIWRLSVAFGVIFIEEIASLFMHNFMHNQVLQIALSKQQWDNVYFGYSVLGVKWAEMFNAVSVLCVLLMETYIFTK